MSRILEAFFRPLSADSAKGEAERSSVGFGLDPS